MKSRLKKWKTWLTQNTAATAPFLDDSFLHPRCYPERTAKDLFSALERLVELNPRWKRVEYREIQKRVRFERRTFLGFVDDVDVYFREGSRGLEVEAASRSRRGKGDFGRNARNLKELLAFLDEAFE